MLSFDTFRSWPNCKVIALHLQYTRRKKPNLEPILHSIDKQSEQFTNCLKKNSRFRTLKERKILLLYLTTRVQISVIVEIAYGGTATLNKATCWPRAYLQHRSLCNSIDFQKKKPKEFCVSQNTYWTWRARRTRKLVFCLSLQRSKNTKATKLSMCTCWTLSKSTSEYKWIHAYSTKIHLTKRIVHIMLNNEHSLTKKNTYIVVRHSYKRPTLYILYIY